MSLTSTERTGALSITITDASMALAKCFLEGNSSSTSLVKPFAPPAFSTVFLLPSLHFRLSSSPYSYRAMPERHNLKTIDNC